MTNQELIDACVKGDPIGQRILYESYSAKLMAISYRYAGNKMDAEDILQEGFVKIFKHLGDLKNEAALAGWMKRIIVNTALKLLAKRKADREKGDLDSVHDKGVSSGVMNELSSQEILALVATLPDGYRTVFNMYVVEGYKHKDIAQKLNIEESTSRTQLLKARKLLMKKYKTLKIV